MRKILPFLLSLFMALSLSECTPSGNPLSSNNFDTTVQLNNPQIGVDVDTQAHDSITPVVELVDIKETGQYTDKERVALYIHNYGHLPSNYIKKREAEELGWISSKGNLNKVAPGKSIGGDNFGNYEGRLPKAKKRKYYECDIDYKSGKRNSKRIIFSTDGLIFYTDDHYNTFTQLY